MLECVVNISEGRRGELIDEIRAVGSDALIDTHSDAVHNRTVLTLAGPDVVEAAKSVTAAAVSLLDIAQHDGVHPRLGVVDVVPFVPILTGNDAAASLEDALAARRTFAEYAAAELELPCFFYGPERGLPEIRRDAFTKLHPDLGPNVPNTRAGACCVGARHALVAYNLWLETADLNRAQSVVRTIRGPQIRSLAFSLDGMVQISCNLVEPFHTGPLEVFDLVASHLAIDHAELVGLIPDAVLRATPRERWAELDLSEDRTIEARVTRSR